MKRSSGTIGREFEPMRRLIIHADGPAGSPGRHGSAGTSGGFSGADGSDGGDAGPASVGSPGGSVHLSLHVEPSGEGYAAAYRTQQGEQQAHERDQLAWTYDVLTLARGGAGGAGGVGGRGGNGATGSRGRDATRYSSGGNGGDGGDGGDGGRGTHGAAGGPGGSILVRVAQNDAYLLMAVQRSEEPSELVAGGEGGPAGRHGSGGSGGSGGAGGSSYSWTETESYTDSQGQRRTRTTHHSNSGGFSGSSGSSGRTPLTPLHPGDRGRPGNFTIELLDASGQATPYPTRYDLVLEAFAFGESDLPTRDGILEFGELIEVTQLRLRNVGGMPTPPKQRVRLTLREREWLLPCEDELFIERSLAPGESIQVEGTLRFHIAHPPAIEPGEALVVQELILPAADQLGPTPEGVAAKDTPFVRRYAKITNGREFEARYPLENREGVRVLRSLAPGERSRLLFEVFNISTVDLGADSSVGRRVRLQLEHVGGEASTQQLVFLDRAGEAHLLLDSERSDSGYFIDLPLVPAGGSFVLEGQIGFVDEVPAYVAAELCVSVWLESIALDGALEPIQRRVASVRAEPAYQACPWSQAVLVTHNEVPRAMYLAWKQLLEDELELACDEWSLARYGHFSASALTTAGVPLADDLREKLVIVLNEPFNPGSSDERALPTDYLSGADFRRCATQGQTRYLVVGSAQFDLGQWLVPTVRERAGGVDYADLRSLRAELPAEGETAYEVQSGTDITTHYDRVAIEVLHWPWGSPALTRLQDIAYRLQRELARRHPHRRYMVVHHDQSPELLGRRFGLLQRFALGQLEVRRSLNLETSAAVCVEADAAAMDDPSFVASRGIRYALMLAMPFHAKLERLNWLMQGSEPLDADRYETGRWLRRALLADLCEEQLALRRASGQLDEAMAQRRLSYLVSLRDFPLTAPRSPKLERRWTLLIQLCAELELLVRSQQPPLRILGRQRRITHFARRCVTRFERDAFADYGGEEGGGLARARPAIEAHYKARRDKIAADLGSLHRWLRTPKLRASVREWYRRPEGLRHSLERELELWRSPKLRVWSAERLYEAQASERLRHSARQAWLAAHTEDRQAMLVQASRADATEPSSGSS